MIRASSAVVLAALTSCGPAMAINLGTTEASSELVVADPSKTPQAVEFMILCNIFLKLGRPMQKRWFLDDGTWKLSENGDVLSLKRLADSTKNSSMEVTLFYDDVPKGMFKPLGQPLGNHFHFFHVNLSDFNNTYNTPANARFFYYQHEINNHPEWKNIFMTDAIDLHVGVCCPGFMPNMLYIGSEQRTKWDQRLKNDWWGIQFKNLGGKWLKWWEESEERMSINDGIVGGDRQIITKFLKHMTDILKDRSIASPWGKWNIDMPASAYITYVYFPDNHHYGAPVHSLFNRWEHDRTDVWFVHK